MCIAEIHEMDITSENNDRIKPNEDQDYCFCGGSEMSRFEWLHKELFSNVFELHLRGRIYCV